MLCVRVFCVFNPFWMVRKPSTQYHPCRIIVNVDVKYLICALFSSISTTIEIPFSIENKRFGYKNVWALFRTENIKNVDLS